MTTNTHTLNQPNMDLSACSLPDHMPQEQPRLTLLGRYMRACKDEFPCRIKNISLHNATVISPHPIDEGEHVIGYFDTLGGLEGKATQISDSDFVMAFSITSRRRQKLASQLAMLIDRRNIHRNKARHSGILKNKPADRPIRVTFEDGEIEKCKALNVALSSASLQSARRPRLGTLITVGKLRARVVRLHSIGFAVEFIDIQKAKAIRQYFSAPSL